MNKYQEALNNICNRCCNYGSCLGLDCPDREEIELLIESFENLSYKATPKKLIHDIVSDSYDEDGFPESFEYEVRKCPNCREHLVDENEDIDFSELPYCPYCGKALDWSDQ